MEFSVNLIIRIWVRYIDCSSFPQNISRLDSNKWEIDIDHTAILIFITLKVWSLLGKVKYNSF